MNIISIDTREYKYTRKKDNESTDDVWIRNGI